MFLRALAIATVLAAFIGAPAIAKPPAKLHPPVSATHAASARPAAVPAPAASAPAPAQPQGQAEPGVPTDVQSFSDWVVRCFPVKSTAPCEVIQVAVNKTTSQRVASVSIAYVPSQDSYATQVVVPLGVALSKGLSLVAGEHKIESLKFRRCENDGCRVEVLLDRATIENFSRGNAAGSIQVFPYKQDKPIALPLSLQGLAPALEKLKDLARQKATAPPAPPQPAPAGAPPGQ